MACPICKGERIVSGGYYITKLYKRRNRFKCKDCGKFFIIGQHLDKVTLKQENEITMLSRKINPYASMMSVKRRHIPSER